VKELNKTIQILKMELETIKKSQRVNTLEIENLEEKSGAMDARTIQQNTRDRRENLRCRRYYKKKYDTTVKEKVPHPKHSGTPGHNGKTKPKDNMY
jgi:TolA-binding protein